MLHFVWWSEVLLTTGVMLLTKTVPQSPFLSFRKSNRNLRRFLYLLNKTKTTRNQNFTHAKI